MKIEIKNPKTFRYYEGRDDLYSKLENYLIENKIGGIGNINSVIKIDPKKNADGILERPKSLSMTKAERAIRTLAIRQVSFDGLLKIHDKELNMPRFLCSFEMPYWAKEKIETRPLYPEEYDQVYELNRGNRPKSIRTFRGYVIPPYFAYDYEWDGMLYHHQWDLLVHKANFELIESAKNKRAKHLV